MWSASFGFTQHILFCTWTYSRVFATTFTNSILCVFEPSFVTAQCGMQFSSRGIRPGLTTVLARHLDKNTMGYLQWRWGSQSSMNTSIVRDTKTSHLTFAMQVRLFYHQGTTPTYTLMPPRCGIFMAHYGNCLRLHDYTIATID